MAVYFPFGYENILIAINSELSRLALMLIKVNGEGILGLSFLVLQVRLATLVGIYVMLRMPTPRQR
jgi:hypothetical protein